MSVFRVFRVRAEVGLGLGFGLGEGSRALSTSCKKKIQPGSSFIGLRVTLGDTDTLTQAVAHDFSKLYVTEVMASPSITRREQRFVMILLYPMLHGGYWIHG